MSAEPEHDVVALTPENIWRDLSYDVGWEAASSGVIRCRAVHNRRADISKAIEGINLRNLWCDSSNKSAFDLLMAAQNFRHVEIRVPALPGPGRLYLTARLLPDGGSAGTICAVHPRDDEVFKGQSALLSHISQARLREEEYRNEAEFMLQGLQVLLNSSTASQKLEVLTGLAVGALRGAKRVALEVHRDGSITTLSAGTPHELRSRTLPALCRQQQAPVSIYKSGEPNTAELRNYLGGGDSDIALMLLPIGSSNVALLCAPAHKSEFRPEDVGFASRFALILRQALILKEEQEKLIQTARLSALGQMSASLAHELRQPLNAISMVAQNLELMSERGAVTPETLDTKVARITEQVERASKIMDRVRRFSRKASEAFEKVDIAKLVEGVRLMMEPDLMTAGIRLKIDVQSDLAVRCDAIQIEQVLTNLVRNAADVLQGIGTAAKTPDGTVTLRGARTESGIALRVEDNGPGFPDDVASRPLETFYTSKSSEHGTGLGLSICHMIAREHAGSLHLGNHGCGAFVELLLPERADAR
ncbi:MAG TPA: ATP-binding protein [Rhizomicrobium sp.]|nr:ATP-binding protein [Rhizomicrobium sp.]